MEKDDHPPTEEDLSQTVDDLNTLLKAAAEDIAKPFEIVIPKM